MRRRIERVIRDMANRRLLQTVIVTSAGLILAACGAQDSDAGEAGLLPLEDVTAENSSATPATQHHRSPKSRDAYGSANGWTIVKTQDPNYCWMVRGNADTAWGLSVDPATEFGLLFMVRNHVPVERVNVRVTLLDAPFLEEGTGYDLEFTNLGTTNSADYVYETPLTDVQLAEVLKAKYISFTAAYFTDRGTSQIGFAHPTRFADEASSVFNECNLSIRQQWG